MTVLDDVRNLIDRLSPAAICDDCIADRLNLSVRQHANHKTRELAADWGYHRETGQCSQCGSRKLIINR